MSISLLVITAIGFAVSLIIHLSTFTGINLLGMSLVINLLHVGMFLIFGYFFLYNKLKLKERKKEYWKKALMSVPKGIVVVWTMIVIYAVFNFFLMTFSLMKNGRASEIDGQTVLRKRGRIVRVITEAEYEQYKNRSIRAASSVWMFGYFLAFYALLGSRFVNVQEEKLKGNAD